MRNESRISYLNCKENEYLLCLGEMDEGEKEWVIWVEFYGLTWATAPLGMRL